MEGSKVAAGDKERLLRKFSRGCSIRMASVLVFLFLSLFSTVIFGSLTSLSSSILFAGDTPPPVWHSMTDEELIQLASSMPWDVPGARKVAFMFLTRGRMPLRPLWERFFAGHDGLFSIYVHASPEFKEEPPEDSIFYKRRVPSKAVEWGRWSMVAAERRLLANALLDPSNARFLLLSESCIPLFDLTTLHAFLFSSPLSFVSSFDDPRHAGRGRYNPRMSPLLSLPDWRKGSQWFQIHRRLAATAVADRRYYPAFRDLCRPPCYADEHYLPTLVAKLFPALNANRSLTWVDWSRGGSHPATYRRRDVSVALIRRLRGGSTCVVDNLHNSTSSCFFFARKFEATSLPPLLRIARAANYLNLY